MQSIPEGGGGISPLNSNQPEAPKETAPKKKGKISLGGMIQRLNKTPIGKIIPRGLIGASNQSSSSLSPNRDAALQGFRSESRAFPKLIPEGWSKKDAESALEAPGDFTWFSDQSSGEPSLYIACRTGLGVNEIEKKSWEEVMGEGTPVPNNTSDLSKELTPKITARFKQTNGSNLFSTELKNPAQIIGKKEVAKEDQKIRENIEQTDNARGRPPAPPSHGQKPRVPPRTPAAPVFQKGFSPTSEPSKSPLILTNHVQRDIMSGKNTLLTRPGTAWTFVKENNEFFAMVKTEDAEGNKKIHTFSLEKHLGVKLTPEDRTINDFANKVEGALKTQDLPNADWGFIGRGKFLS